MIQLTLTLKMTTAQVVETSVTVNDSPFQDYIHLDGHTQPTYEKDGNSNHLMWNILWLVLAKTGFPFFIAMAEKSPAIKATSTI